MRHQEDAAQGGVMGITLRPDGRESGVAPTTVEHVLVICSREDCGSLVSGLQRIGYW